MNIPKKSIYSRRSKNDVHAEEGQVETRTKAFFFEEILIKKFIYNTSEYGGFDPKTA